MREFIYFSQHARTSGNFNERELMKAGRMDIVIHVIIAAFFLSHKLRDNVKLHLIFYGQPTPPRHLEFDSSKKIPISKKDVSGLIKRMLYKYKEGRKKQVFPGCYIEKKNLMELIDELKKQGKEIYILDTKGDDIRKTKIKKDKAVFLIGDHEGLPKKELKRLKKQCKFISVGKQTYFASHTLAIVNNELDRNEFA